MVRARGTILVCVLLDFTMPHMSGEEIFVELQKIRDDVPVLLMSGYSEEQFEKSVGKFSFAGILKKPLGREVLLREIRSVL